jgi:dTDP-4-amino-4,6-dideoxygalactose transaminase
LLADIPSITTPTAADGRGHVYHLYVIETDERDALQSALKARGVPTVINYRRALPFLPAYADRGHTADDFPVAHRLQERILSLPIYAELSEAQQDEVVAGVRDAMNVEK